MAKTPEELCKEREKRIVNSVQLKIPGTVSFSIPFSFFPAEYTVPLNSIHRFVGGEYMTADEYDLFLDDNPDLLIRRCLPPVYGSLESLSMLPPFFFRGVYDSCLEYLPGLHRIQVEPVKSRAMVDFTREYGRYN